MIRGPAPLKTKSRPCLSILTNSTKKSVWKKLVGTDVYKQVAERIDGAPVLNDYISSRVSESPEDLFFFNTSKLNMYRNASENSKAEIAGAANFCMIESLLRTTMSEESSFLIFSGCL